MGFRRSAGIRAACVSGSVVAQTLAISEGVKMICVAGVGGAVGVGGVALSVVAPQKF